MISAPRIEIKEEAVRLKQPGFVPKLGWLGVGASRTDIHACELDFVKMGGHEILRAYLAGGTPFVVPSISKKSDFNRVKTKPSIRGLGCFQ